MNAWQHTRVRDRVRDMLVRQGGQPLRDTELDLWIEELETFPLEQMARDVRRICIVLETFAYAGALLLLWWAFMRV